jgi:hypothetical protein
LLFQIHNLYRYGPAQKKPPVTVKYEIPYFTISGVQVRYLKVRLYKCVLVLLQKMSATRSSMETDKLVRSTIKQASVHVEFS